MLTIIWPEVVVGHASEPGKPIVIEGDLHRAAVWRELRARGWRIMHSGGSHGCVIRKMSGEEVPLPVVASHPVLYDEGDAARLRDLLGGGRTVTEWTCTVHPRRQRQ